jgi:hypothetical protein
VSGVRTRTLHILCIVLSSRAKLTGTDIINHIFVIHSLFSIQNRKKEFLYSLFTAKNIDITVNRHSKLNLSRILIFSILLSSDTAVSRKRWGWRREDIIDRFSFECLLLILVLIIGNEIRILLNMFSYFNFQV